MSRSKLVKPIKVHGGKDYLASRIVDLFPKKYLTLCEPYAGGCSVTLAADPEGHSEIINDLDSDLMNFWEVLRDERLFRQFHDAIQATPFSETLFNVSKRNLLLKPFFGSAVRRAIDFFIVARQSLAGRRKDFTPISTSRVRRGMNEQVSAWLTSIEGLQAIHERIKRILILSESALDVISYIDSKDTLFYCDPPYIHDSRVSKDAYCGFEMSDADHISLLCALSMVKGKFILSGYRSKIYDEFATKCKWRRVDFDIANHSAGGKSKRRMVECVWLNYKG